MTLPLGYKNKRVLLTGASSGIGEATGKALVELEAEVIGVDIQSPKYDLNEFRKVDLRDREAIDTLISNVGKVDKLFYCAGLPSGEQFSPLDIVTVNFIAMRQIAEALVPKMSAGDAIVSVASGWGMGYMAHTEQLDSFLATPDFESAQQWVRDHENEVWADGYALSKMSNILYTLRAPTNFAAAYGVRVNCISPGPTKTNMVEAWLEEVGEEFINQAYPSPFGRLSMPEEQAWPLVFLNSDMASHISGENLYTDAGTANGILTGVIEPPPTG